MPHVLLACSRQPFLIWSIHVKNLQKVQCLWELGITSGKLVKETRSILLQKTVIQVNIAQKKKEAGYIHSRRCFPFHVSELAKRYRCVYARVCKSQVTDPRWWAWGTLRSSFRAWCFVAEHSLSLCPHVVIWSQLKREQELNAHKEPLLISSKPQIRSKAKAQRCPALLWALSKLSSASHLIKRYCVWMRIAIICIAFHESTVSATGLVLYRTPFSPHRVLKYNVRWRLSRIQVDFFLAGNSY